MSSFGLQVGRTQPVRNVELPAPAKGAAAISALGSHLPTVAQAYGLPAQALSTLFRLQPTLAVDRQGSLVFLCEALPASGATAGSALPAPATATSADALNLHSLPGAPLVIYLDFNGHTTTGTSWNSSFASGNSIVSQPFDLDGAPATVGPTEMAFIFKVWQRVAEDFAPFRVNVTTADPGLEALRKSDSADTAYGVRVVISPTNWYSTNAGGVAYVGSFTWNSDTPCYAFTGQLANGEKYIAECISHETGHTLGLYHDGLGGTSPTEYYQGQGSWAPIMGNSYYKSVTQFSRGEYINANNTQDDLTVIAGFVPLTADDHGGTLASATVLAGPSVRDGGTLESRTDLDVFRFDTGAGSISLSIQCPGPAGNADLKAELLNSAGTVMVTNDPATLATSINATVAAGTYFLRLSSVGYGDPTTTGYSNYASIGDYVITGTLISTGLKQPPVASAIASTTSGTVPLTVTFSSNGSHDPDGTVLAYAWSFASGATSTESNPTYTFSAAGTYTVTLTVTDNDGLSSMATVEITANPPPNQSPTAVITASATTGTAPLPVTFAGTGSFDPDGTIVAYLWSFGDGTTSSLVSPSKAYSVPGTYTVQLKVTDDRGGIATATTSVIVSPDRNLDVDVSQFGITKLTESRGKSMVATITVRDRLGRPASGTTVEVSWSGLLSGKSTGTTDSNGQLTVSSSRTKKSGNATATITAIVPPGGSAYDPGLFTEPISRSLSL
ncbi:MAG: PKD domain-containing protein [Opitutaceae bacterium]|nr:PKD domain-containing protein [Opitutaceae bacterium]